MLAFVVYRIFVSLLLFKTICISVYIEGIVSLNDSAMGFRAEDVIQCLLYRGAACDASLTA